MDDVLIGIRAIHLAATVMLAGAIFFQLLVAEPAFQTSNAAPSIVTAMRAWQARLMWITLAVGIVSGAAWLVEIAAIISGQTRFEALSNGTAWTVATETQFGHAWTIRLVAATFLAGWLLVFAATDTASLSRWRWVPLGVAGCFVGAIAWAGHSGATPGRTGDLQLASDVVHLLAAAAWVGGLVPLAILLAFARRAANEQAAGLAAGVAYRFSTLGIASVGGLLATGLVNSWALVGSMRAFVETDYGCLLLLKIILFAVMLVLAIVNRLRLLPHVRDVGAMSQLQRNSLTEAVLGVMVIVIVAALGTIEPAIHAMHAPHVH